ncbi:MAG: hypothetical protein ACKVS9_08970 [Phycisphaerae bacterium]
MLRTKMLLTPPAPATKFVARLLNATNLPLEETLGSTQSAFGCVRFNP